MRLLQKTERGRGNFGIDGDKDLNEDAWQVYMQWQTNFDELWQRN